MTPYQILGKQGAETRCGTVPRPGMSAAHGQLRIRMARLWYDTPHVEAIALPGSFGEIMGGKAAG